MKKVLMLSYCYPPSGGAGVQRTTKFVKYLPACGYAPRVVGGTGSPAGGRIPEDPKLMDDVRDAPLDAVRLSAWERRLKRAEAKMGRYLPAMSFCWWVRAAERAGHDLILRDRPDLLYVTVSPYPAAKAAASLAGRHRLPWVLDMRDPWALDPINYYVSRLHHAWDLRAMRVACEQATAVIMNTPESLRALQDAFGHLPVEKLFCIPNGWDRGDFQPSVDSTPRQDAGGRFTIVHTGQFHTAGARRVDPGSRAVLGGPVRLRWRDRLRYSVGRPHLLARTPYYLFKAVRKLLDEGNANARALRLVFVGSATPEDRSLASRFGLNDITEFPGYAMHARSVQMLESADALFLPLHEPADRRGALIVPGKTYEYLAARKPILACVPPGDTREFVRRAGVGFVCDPTDVAGIAAVLSDLLARHREGGLRCQPNDEFIERFERSRLAGDLARVFDFALGGARSRLTCDCL
ncbi:MAG: glycosyltransferase [Phycisphaerae bacterium]|nr:glycosyltransferase [Phycisphaerae bacterium]